MAKLQITINVEDKIEAYRIVTEVGLEHEVVGADFDGYKEKFGKDNSPAMFMKDNKKTMLKFRSKDDFKAEKEARTPSRIKY